MKHLFSPVLLLLAMVVSSCRTGLLETGLVRIPVNRSSTSQQAQDLFKIDGFTALETGDAIDLRGISKVLFKDETVVVLNYVGDKQDVWVFDQHTGKVRNKIGSQSNEPNGYEGLNDILLDEDQIRCSVAGKMAFFNYDLGGNLLSKTQSGVFGEEVERASDGSYVVYNEYNSTKISGLNHILLYDRSGNLTKRLYPYLETQDGNGYAFAGSLTASDGIWFNPPFCDTLFEVRKDEMVAQYHFDFGQKAMPENVRQQKMTGWDTERYAFLGEGLAKVGKFLVFEYAEDQKVNLGVFDETTGQFVSFRDLKEDHLFELLQVGDIFPKDQNSFALLLRPSRIQYMLKQKQLNLDAISKEYPDLAQALNLVELSNSPVILYLSFVPGARIDKASEKR